MFTNPPLQVKCITFPKSDLRRASPLSLTDFSRFNTRLVSTAPERGDGAFVHILDGELLFEDGILELRRESPSDQGDDEKNNSSSISKEQADRTRTSTQQERPDSSSMTPSPPQQEDPGPLFCLSAKDDFVGEGGMGLVFKCKVTKEFPACLVEGEALQQDPCASVSEFILKLEPLADYNKFLQARELT